MLKKHEALCRRLGADFNSANTSLGASALSGMQMAHVWGRGGATVAPTAGPTTVPTPSPDQGVTPPPTPQRPVSGSVSASVSTGAGGTSASAGANISWGNLKSGANVSHNFSNSVTTYSISVSYTF
jgi:hypothetical protein